MKLLVVLFCSLSSLLCHVRTATSSELISTPHALTISGGSSLGIYEAGLNWVIADAFRNLSKKHNYEAFTLDTITGASAGAVNAVMAAMHNCQVPTESPKFRDNPFFNAWDIDINKLLTLDKNDYDQMSLKIHAAASPVPVNEVLKDSLFARGALSDSVDEIRELAESNIYRPNCQLNLGIMVTHSEPQMVTIETLKDSDDPEQKIPVQRFVIPLRVETKASDAGDSTKIVFRNNIAYASARDKNEGYLFLPEDKRWRNRYRLRHTGSFCIQRFSARFRAGTHGLLYSRQLLKQLVGLTVLVRWLMVYLWLWIMGILSMAGRLKIFHWAWRWIC